MSCVWFSQHLTHMPSILSTVYSQFCKAGMNGLQMSKLGVFIQHTLLQTVSVGVCSGMQMPSRLQSGLVAKPGGFTPRSSWLESSYPSTWFKYCFLLSSYPEWPFSACRGLPSLVGLGAAESLLSLAPDSMTLVQVFLFYFMKSCILALLE